MSEIPYYFDTPVPRYFREHGWFKDHEMQILITWCFSRCNSIKKIVTHDCKNIELDPFEFIFGRSICSKETGLSEQTIRTLMNKLCWSNQHINQPAEVVALHVALLEKSTSKSTSKYSVYKWVLIHFSKNANQQINQQTNQQLTSNPPKINHKQEDRQQTEDLSLSCLVSACAREEKKEDEKIISMPEIVIFKCHKHPSIISIRMTELFADLLAKGFDDKEIEAALKIAKENDPVISSTIEKYIEGIILNKRKEKHAKPKSRSSKRNNSFNDSLERSREALSVPSVSWKRS